MTLFLFTVSALFLTSLVIEKQKDKSDASTVRTCVMLCIVLGLLGAMIEPKEIYDLSRNYRFIDNIRAYGFTLKEYLDYGYLYNDLNYKYTYVYNIILYVIAQTLPNQALPFIAIAFSYASFLYIYLDSNMQAENRLTRLTSISLFSVLLPYLYIYSGIRNALAACMVALAIYQYMMKGFIVVPLVLALSAIMIHPVAGALIPFVLLSKVKPRIWSCAAIGLFPSMLFNLTEFFRLRLGNDFLFRISAKYYNYLLVRNDNQGKAFLYSSIICISLIVLVSLVSTYLEESNMHRICYTITWYALFCLGYSSSYELATRLPYNISALSPVIVCYFLNSDKRNLKTFQLLICLIIILLSLIILYENIAWLI